MNIETPILSIMDHNKFYQNENDSFFSYPDSFKGDEDPLFNPISNNQNLELNFGVIGEVMNLEPISDENENLAQQIYFFKNEEEKEKEKENCNSFLNKKRNNNSNFEEQLEFKNKPKKAPRETKKETKETKESTGGNSPKLKKKLFDSKQKIYRNDYYIKKFKVECFSNYLTQNLNDLLKACSFPKNLKLNKIYMPNNKAFTSVANMKLNQAFLPMRIKDIFSMENGNGQYQKKNASIFTMILNEKELASKKKEYEELVDCLNMTVEDAIKKFYFSEEFEHFRINLEIKEYDDAFKKEKKFSLLENFGFLKLIKNQY